MRKRKTLPLFFLQAFLLFLSLYSVCFSAPVFLNGAGATFPFPLYSKWFFEYQKSHPEVKINYQSIGSGGGIRQLTEKTVDFGASDAPMTDDMIAKTKEAVLHIPTVLGAVVLTYNLPIKDLNLSSSVVADIFLGKIQKWNDPQIQKLNSKQNLPATDIIVVHRSDGSGTTHIFTDYLSKISTEWKDRVGTGTAVKWPAGLGGKGNEGVTGLIKQTPGSFGYVELIYAESNGLSVALLQNKAGTFVKPNLKSVTEAAGQSLKSIPEDFRVSITNSDGKNAYPISGFTYLLIYKKMDALKGKELNNFLNWAMGPGQEMAEKQLYSKLPANLISKVKAKIKTMEF